MAIERRFDRHREDVRWIAADTVSERGAGRLAVSYDAGHTAIVWDIATGDEISRFAAYEEIRVATWMRNGNIAFGKTATVKGWVMVLTVCRQCPRQCDIIRAIYVRAYLGQDHI